MRNKIFLNSIPKTGTNLVQKLFSLFDIPYSRKSLASSSILGRYGLAKRILRSPLWFEQPLKIGLDNPVVVSSRWVQSYFSQDRGYISGHAAYSDHLYQLLIENKYKVVQVIRHPGAFIYSWAKFIVEPGYFWSEARQALISLPIDQRLELMITGGKAGAVSYPGIRDILSRAEGWYLKEGIKVVRFEDLIGPEGGGDPERQEQTILELLEYLNLDRSEVEIQDLKSNLFGGTHTFRVGSIDLWREEIHPDIYKSLWNEISSFSFLKDLGYTE